jgi:hypothetical protein
VSGFIPVQDAAYEGEDQEGASLCGGNSLHQREREGQITVDAVLRLQDVGGPNTLPSGGNFDEMRSFEMPFSSYSCRMLLSTCILLTHNIVFRTYYNDLEGLSNGALGVKG